MVIPPPIPLTEETLWREGCSIYEIYIRSFYDANGDGIGDLRGIYQRLDYVAKLGVDAVWISPFFPSPMKDFGYDVSDYCAVDPRFGSLADFDDVMAKARTLGLKVIMDQVWSHTSEAHAWFVASADPAHPDYETYKDWFVWADAHPETGDAPNNWLSVFGGAAWEWGPRRQQYYLHNFLKEQPDLNWRNPAVRDAIAEAARFWLDLGVDGFRLDACNFFTHDSQLRDNPAKEDDTPRLIGIDQKNPFAEQRPLYNINQPETLVYLQELKQKTIDHYHGRALLGEIVAVNYPIQTMHTYINHEIRLATAYSGALAHDGLFTVEEIADLLCRCEQEMPGQMVCWLTGTHDFPRFASRCGVASPKLKDAYLRLSILLLAAMRGHIGIYQGEELGLEEAVIAYEDMQDPYGIALHPRLKPGTVVAPRCRGQRMSRTSALVQPKSPGCQPGLRMGKTPLP